MANNEQNLEKLITAVGGMSELYLMTFNNFKKQGASDEVALGLTKIMLDTMVRNVFDSGRNEDA